MTIDLSSVTIAATQPRHKIAQALREMGIQIKTLDEDEGNVDRYVVSERLAIERRTGASFLKGIMDKTLFTSAIYLREHFEIPVLMVEGKVDDNYSMMTPAAVRGALSSMMLQYGISVLCTEDAEQTVELIAMMARQEQIGIPEISLIPKRKATSLDDLQRRVVEMLPGCGMVVARELLQHFGSVQRIVAATEDEFRAVKGIGAKTAREIVRVLTADYEAIDTEKQLEDAIEAAPELLFQDQATLLARQHYIFTDEGERQFVDMAFLEPKANEVVLVELKRGALERAHEEQLGRYLDHAGDSKLLARFLGKGAGLRGVLATAQPCKFRPKRKDVDARIVDRRAAIEVLKRLRRQRETQTR